MYNTNNGESNGKQYGQLDENCGYIEQLRGLTCKFLNKRGQFRGFINL